MVHREDSKKEKAEEASQGDSSSAEAAKGSSSSSGGGSEPIRKVTCRIFSALSGGNKSENNKSDSTSSKDSGKARFVSVGCLSYQ